jgi:nucleoside-diphosphate-sugar epimerase
MVEGDLRRPLSLEGPLEGVKQVVHLAALIGSTEADENLAVNAQGTLNLLAAASAAGVQRIVALSSDSVLRGRRSPYAQSKAQAEEALLAWGIPQGRSVLVLRPPMILGPQSKHLQTFARLSRSPILPLPRRTAQRCPVFVEDVTAAILKALDLPDSEVPSGVIDLPGETSLDFGELIAAVAKSAGRRPPRIQRIPGVALKQLARLAGPRAAEQLQGIEEEVSLDGSVARELLGWSPMPLEQLLARSLA